MECNVQAFAFDKVEIGRLEEFTCRDEAIASSSMNNIMYEWVDEGRHVIRAQVMT